jgi:hypothetical protein
MYSALCKLSTLKDLVPKGGLTNPAVSPLSESFLIFLSIPTLCVIALFTPFVLTGLSCDSDVTPSFQA